jgi:hypothetical protein
MGVVFQFLTSDPLIALVALNLAREHFTVNLNFHAVLNREKPDLVDLASSST